MMGKVKNLVVITLMGKVIFSPGRSFVGGRGHSFGV